MKRWKEVILDTEIYIGKCLKSGLAIVVLGTHWRWSWKQQPAPACRWLALVGHSWQGWGGPEQPPRP